MTQHCYTCHLDSKPGDKHFWKCDKVERECATCPRKELRNLGERIAEDKRDKERVIGVFGDEKPNIGIVESYRNIGQGLETKFYGNEIWFKGRLNKGMIDGGVPLKAALMGGIRQAKNLKLFILLASPLLIMFHKQLIKAFVYWFSELYDKDLKQKTLTNLEQFSPVTKEMIRAGYKLADRIPVTTDISQEYGGTEGIWHEGEKNDQEYRVRVRRCIWAVVTFIQADFAYYSRVQDALNCVKEKSVKGLKEAFDEVVRREKQIGEKIGLLRMAFNTLLFLPPIRKYVILYLQEFDLEQAKPDEADRYYSYRRSCYDFEGKPWEERVSWARELDEKYNNVIIE